VLITGRRPDDHGAQPCCAGTSSHCWNRGLEHIESVRIGSKSLAYWPQRFVSDPDADETLRLFEQVVDSGRSARVHGALLTSPRAGIRAGCGGQPPDQGYRSRDPHPRPPLIRDDQRRSGDLGLDVADPGADGAMVPYYMFRGARHRAAGLLRGAARDRATASSGTPTGRWPGLCRTVPRARRCRRLPARGVAWTGSPTWRASGVFVPCRHDPGPGSRTCRAAVFFRPTTTADANLAHRPAGPAFASRFPVRDHHTEDLAGALVPGGLRSRPVELAGWPQPASRLKAPGLRPAEGGPSWARGRPGVFRGPPPVAAGPP